MALLVWVFYKFSGSVLTWDAENPVWSLPSTRDVDPRDGEGDAPSLQQSHPSPGQGFGVFWALAMSPAGARARRRLGARPAAALPTSAHSCRHRLP